MPVLMVLSMQLAAPLGNQMFACAMLSVERLDLDGEGVESMHATRSCVAEAQRLRQECQRSIQNVF